MKTLALFTFAIVSAVALAEEGLDRNKWQAFSARAEEQAQKEFAKEFAFDALGWERGKGVNYFAWVLPDGRFCMKFDSEGRLEKVALENDFPELVRFNARKRELTRQLRKDYAESLGLTVEEAEKKVAETRRNCLLRPSRAVSKNQQGNEIALRIPSKAEVEAWVGFKFGQAPIEGVRTNEMSYSCNPSHMSYQIIKLAKPYRYMNEAKLSYAEGQLFRIELFANFGEDISLESIEQEATAMQKDLSDKFGWDVRRISNWFRIDGKGFTVSISSDSEVGPRKIRLVIEDKETLSEMRMQAWKRGRALPKLPSEE